MRSAPPMSVLTLDRPTQMHRGNRSRKPGLADGVERGKVGHCKRPDFRNRFALGNLVTYGSQDDAPATMVSECVSIRERSNQHGKLFFGGRSSQDWRAATVNAAMGLTACTAEPNCSVRETLSKLRKAPKPVRLAREPAPPVRPEFRFDSERQKPKPVH